MTDFPALLRLLVGAQVEFVVIGGVAASAHGSARLTSDLDIVYGRSEANIERLVAALSTIHPYLRGAPPGLPFTWDARTVALGLNFTLVTDKGAIDLLGEAAGNGTYASLMDDSIELALFGITCRFVDLERLILLKRAAGRPKDLEVIAELEALRDEGAKEG